MKILIENLIKISLAVLILFSVSCSENSTSNDDNTLEWNKKIAKYAVHNHAMVLSELIKPLSNQQEIILLIRKSIDSVRFYEDKSGYFYVYDFDCVNIAHATQKDKEGQNLYDYQDTKGKFVVRELADAASKGGGYVEFYWQKPGETLQSKKLGYVEPIRGTNYFIGSGVYLE